MSARVAVLTIGDELLNGERADTNTRLIARQLAPLGLNLRESLSVGDDEEDIATALRELAARREIVLVTGGLGATGDDLTARGAARAFGRRLALNEEALRLVREHFRRRGEPMHPRNEKQALLPQLARLIPNPTGSAPGFWLQQERTQLFFLPGVPSETSVMLEQSVIPQLRELAAPAARSAERVYVVIGLPEPRVEELAEEAGLPQGVRLAFGVDHPFVHLKLRADGADAPELFDRCEPPLRRAFGDHLISSDGTPLNVTVAQLLTRAGKTLAIAESCTGGLLSTMLTALPGASAFLERSAVTYANSAKLTWLKIPPLLLEKEGAVSETTARLMARGIRRAAHSDYGLAVTGIAGPGGGSTEKPVGTVYLAVACEAGEEVRLCRFSGERHEIQRQSACHALNLLRLVHLEQLLATSGSDGSA